MIDTHHSETKPAWIAHFLGMRCYWMSRDPGERVQRRTLFLEPMQDSVVYFEPASGDQREVIAASFLFCDHQTCNFIRANRSNRVEHRRAMQLYIFLFLVVFITIIKRKRNGM